MARHLSEPQASTLAAFVRALYRAGEFVSWAEFAREAGYPATNLSDVQLGKAGIDGLNLLRLIEAAARRAGRESTSLALEASAAEQPQPSHAPLSLEAHLEGIAATLRDLATGQELILGRLPPAAAAEPPQAHPTQSQVPQP